MSELASAGREYLEAATGQSVFVWSYTSATGQYVATVATADRPPVVVAVRRQERKAP